MHNCPFLRNNMYKYYLKGGKKMMVFKYGTEPLELEPNSEITSYVI